MAIGCLGTKMMNKLHEIAVTEKHLQKIELAVNHDNPAKTLYERLGYQKVGTISEFNMLKYRKLFDE